MCMCECVCLCVCTCVCICTCECVSVCVCLTLDKVFVDLESRVSSLKVCELVFRFFSVLNHHTRKKPSDIFGKDSRRVVRSDLTLGEVFQLNKITL